MQKLFSTETVPIQMRFRSWSEYCERSVVQLDRHRIGDGAFHASLLGAEFGKIFVTRSSYSPLKTHATARTIRRNNSKASSLFVNLKLFGRAIVTQNNQTILQNEGEFAIYDTTVPFEIVHPDDVAHLVIEVPRERLERMLGVAQNFTGLTMGRDQPTASLLRSFFMKLMSLPDQLSADAKERMSSIGVDLIVASIAERMSLGTPAELRGTVVVQRAKAYIESNLSSLDLNPANVAAAANVSLRYLQERFRERGQHISDWIWQRRLETAAQRLADPVLMHMSLDSLAYSCGFTSHAHFSRRFKDRYDVGPSDYRRSALAAIVARRNGPSAE